MVQVCGLLRKDGWKVRRKPMALTTGLGPDLLAGVVKALKITVLSSAGGGSL